MTQRIRCKWWFAHNHLNRASQKVIALKHQKSVPGVHSTTYFYISLPTAEEVVSSIFEFFVCGDRLVTFVQMRVYVCTSRTYSFLLANWKGYNCGKQWTCLRIRKQWLKCRIETGSQSVVVTYVCLSLFSTNFNTTEGRRSDKTIYRNHPHS